MVRHGSPHGVPRAMDVHGIAMDFHGISVGSHGADGHKNARGIAIEMSHGGAI